ncbi:MAG TPA: cyclopropane-fatty-acyl-phospholipid synthase family protein [Solirubrobacteraceae bacterium]|nr:cyclopropane-fatty-acyl-phospholipid synthase family protein [Solirubrobacteraceae bacterium]
MSGLARLVTRILLRHIRSGTLVVVEPDALRSYGRGLPHARVEVRSRRVWRELLRGSLGLGESYAAGDWESPDLVSVMRIAARNVGGLDRARARLWPLWRPLQYLRVLRRPATRRRRRQDIAAHYDVGNRLFSRMLDPTMMYSCALFSTAEMSLEQAQRRKLELICQKLELGPGERVLEIGTGWGGFALYAARTRRCHVTTTTISEEQYTYAREQVRRAGLDDLITVLRKDYRDLRGQYDKLVSIEMIEAVGWRHTGRFLAICSRLLAAHGAMLLQAITIDDRLYEAEKAARSFITEHIFPGGSLPSLASLSSDLSRHTDLRTISLQELTPHYVRTLQVWRQRLTGHLEELSELGYDERFQRIWMLYLAYCEAGFAERRIGDFQLLLGKPGCRLGGEPAPALLAGATVRRPSVPSDRAVVTSPAG